MTRFVEGVVYESKDGPYDPDMPDYNYYLPTETGNFQLCDCWVCNSNGEIHPGLSYAPVPVSPESLGMAIKNLRS